MAALKALHTTGAKEPTRTARWQEKRSAIIAIAEECFAKHGFAGTRLEDITDRLGIQRPSLVYYFKDKNELYDETIAEIVKDILVRVEDDAEKFECGIPMNEIPQLLLNFSLERPYAAKILVRQLIEEDLPKSGSSKPYVKALFQQLQQSRMQTGETNELIQDGTRIESILALSCLPLLWVSMAGTVDRGLAYNTRDLESIASFRKILLRLADEPAVTQ